MHLHGYYFSDEALRGVAMRGVAMHPRIRLHVFSGHPV